MGFHPIIHGLLSDGSTKFNSNISFDKFPPSRKPTSFATISALSCTWSESWGLVHSLLMNWILRCFPSRGTSHFMYNSSLSSVVKRVVNLLAKNSLSRFSDLRLHKHIKNINVNFASTYTGRSNTTKQVQHFFGFDWF